MDSHNVREYTGVLPPPDQWVGTKYLWDYLLFLVGVLESIKYWKGNREENNFLVGPVKVGYCLSLQEVFVSLVA